MKLSMPAMEEPELSVAPLIDMVFLLLVYFMSTASLIKSEGDLGIQLPGMVAQAESVDMPDEQIIEVRGNGQVYLNDREYDRFDSMDMPQLTETLVRYRLASEATKNKAMITINGHNNAMHQRVIDVLNACAAAGITNVTFAGSSDAEE